MAAESEEIARDALDKIKIEFEQLPHLANEEDLSKAGEHAKAAGSETSGDPDKAFSDPEVVISEGYYGMAAITHCCLETHGSVAEWTGPDTLKTYFSTQSVSGIPGEVGEALRLAGIDVKNNNIETICQYIGGGFGSKFSADRWGIENARLAKMAGKPVKLLLERDMDLEVAGARPSSYAKIKVAAKKDGMIVAWQSDSWGSGGPEPPRCLIPATSWEGWMLRPAHSNPWHPVQRLQHPSVVEPIAQSLQSTRPSRLRQNHDRGAAGARFT